MTNATILFEQQGDIASLTLNRPDTCNAFDDQMISTCTSYLEKIQNDDSIQVVILHAHGKHFCAGADLNWMKRMVDYSEDENSRDAMALSELLHTLYHLPQTSIALVQGHAIGGGAGLVACCDIAIASDDAQFCFSEVKLGLAPAVISPYILRAIGERQTRYYFLSATRFDAKKAQDIHLVHNIVPRKQLIDSGQQLAKQIATHPPLAVRACKQLINDVSNNPLDTELQHALAKYIAALRVGKEAQAAMQTFLGKDS